MKRLRKLLQLSVRDYQLLAFTFALLHLIRLGLGLLPFRVLMKRVDGVCRSRLGGEKGQTRSVRQLIWAVDCSSRRTIGSVKCLARALTTKILLSHHGYESELRIGVMRGENGKFEAHAWIEYQGRVIIGELNTLSDFVPLPSLDNLIT